MRRVGIEWTIRVVQRRGDRDELSGLWIEQFRRMGYVKELGDNDSRVVFEIYAPRGISNTMTKTWAESHAERMRSFTINAVAAPKWDGEKLTSLV